MKRVLGGVDHFPGQVDDVFLKQLQLFLKTQLCGLPNCKAMRSTNTIEASRFMH